MYTEEQLAVARTTDAYDFLLSRHAGQVKKEGAYLRIPHHGGVLVHKGYYGYYDSTNNKHGNSVDLLMTYFGYGLKEAVEVLAGASETPVKSSDKPEPIKHYAGMPKPIEGSYRRVFAYLIKNRGLPKNIVSDLVHRRILYEDEKHNAVFISGDRKIAEVRGTSSYTDFKSTRRTEPNGFWWYQPTENEAETVYICESAIDAVSLYLLIQDKHGVYVSMAGIGNRQVIDRIRKKKPVFICTDNDKKGQVVRDEYSDLPNLIPRLKDWNEELKAVRR